MLRHQGCWRNSCENENEYFIVGCDSNVHHTAWGCTNCNGREEALMEFLNSSTFDILNEGNESSFAVVLGKR
jgi:hypothetical protein